MLSYRNILFFAWCAFVVCPEIKVVTEQQFADWGCSSLCDEENNRDWVKDICVGFAQNIENPYPEEQIKAKSGCVITKVALKTREGNIEHKSRHVGLCHIGRNYSTCISAAPNKDDLFVWSRSNENVCEPDVIVKGAFAEKKK